MVGDFSNRLPFNDGFFDAVVDVEAISCNDFQSSKDIYSEAHRVLKNNGKIFSKMFTDRCVGINNGKGKNSGFVKANKGPLKDLGHIRFTSYVDVLKLFGDFNLEDIELVARSSFLSDQQSVEEWVVVANKL
jgi:SAM-dependent methyltransferase